MRKGPSQAGSLRHLVTARIGGRLPALENLPGFCKHTRPVGANRLYAEVPNGEPQEILHRDAPSRTVRSRDLVSLAAGTGTQVEMWESDWAPALRVPVVGNDLLIV